MTKAVRKTWVASVMICAVAGCGLGRAQTVPLPQGYISPARPVPVGKAPGMQVKRLREDAQGWTYVIVFHKGDDVMSGLTDFAIANKVQDASFTGIGAVSGATLAWLDLAVKAYRPIPVTSQAEVLSLIGDVAAFNEKPVVHMHAVLGGPNGNTIGGHVFELIVDPTVEVFMTVHRAPLKKKQDEASGIKLIDPAQ